MKKKKIKGVSPEFANAIVNLDLTVIKSNTSFQKFFKNHKNWSDPKIKITQLIEFEDLSKFKKSLLNSKKGKIKERTFRGKIKVSNANQPILVKVSHVKNDVDSWSNQVVNLTCETTRDFSFSEYFQINSHLFDDFPFEIFVIDNSFRLVYFKIRDNENIKDLIASEPVLGLKFFPFRKNEKDWKANLKRIFSGEKLVYEKMEVIENQECLWLLSPFKDSDGVVLGCMIFFKNLTKLNQTGKKKAKNQNEEIKALKKRAEQSEKELHHLQEELDSSLRELHSNLILISQKNHLLKSIGDRVGKLISNSGNELSEELRKIGKSISSQINIDDNWKKFKIHFVKTNPDFFNNLKAQSKTLSENDLRHCAYLRIGLSVKETAQLLSILPSSIEMARYRIKKKLNLGKDQKLSNYVRGL